MDDLDRLGRPGAYRLGMLRAGFEPDPAPPSRPAFARQARRRQTAARVLALLAGVAAVVAAARGLFVVPLAVAVPAAAWLAWRLLPPRPAAPGDVPEVPAGDAAAGRDEQRGDRVRVLTARKPRLHDRG